VELKIEGGWKEVGFEVGSRGVSHEPKPLGIPGLREGGFEGLAMFLVTSECASGSAGVDDIKVRLSSVAVRSDVKCSGCPRLMTRSSEQTLAGPKLIGSAADPNWINYFNVMLHSVALFPCMWPNRISQQFPLTSKGIARTEQP
jgi:hypothetical protein